MADSNRLSREARVRHMEVIFASRQEPLWDALYKTALDGREEARDAMEAAMTPAEVAAAQGEALAWKKILKVLTDKPLLK